MVDRVQAELNRRYAEDYMLAASMVYYWRKQRPDNEELMALSLSLADMHKYVQGLQNEVETLRKIINESDKS